MRDRSHVDMFVNKQYLLTDLALAFLCVLVMLLVGWKLAVKCSQPSQPQRSDLRHAASMVAQPGSSGAGRQSSKP
eukprot:3460759-Amphidinium_carterae.2